MTEEYAIIMIIGITILTIALFFVDDIITYYVKKQELKRRGIEASCKTCRFFEKRNKGKNGMCYKHFRIRNINKFCKLHETEL